MEDATAYTIIGTAVAIMITIAWIIIDDRRHRINEPDRVTRWSFEKAFQDTMAIPLEGRPEHQIKAWTPQEREALGVNDTMRFLAETERILNHLEWKQLTTSDDRRRELIQEFRREAGDYNYGGIV